MTIIEQLAKLAELAPDVCQLDNGVFSIGDYHFWNSEYYGFCAAHKSKPHTYMATQPALDWLQGALQRVIEARGDDWEMESYKTNKGMRYQARIAKPYQKYQIGATPTEALLGVLIKAVGEV